MITLSVKGILLLYHHPLTAYASTLMEHISAFKRYSQFDVWSVNTEFGFPQGLRNLNFEIIVLHYSVFGYAQYKLNPDFLEYLTQSKAAYKIAFFQDEYCYCQQRFAFLNEFNIDCVYTLLEPAYFKDVYKKYTRVPKIIYTLTGYVDDTLVHKTALLTKPESMRTVDVGYRARPLPYYLGRGAQEKTEIADKFVRYAQPMGLTLDIKTNEHDRIYGNTWYKFLANCRGVIGVEAGVSVFDIEDQARLACERLLTDAPGMNFADVAAQVLAPWEDNIYYRTISPRHFEAAALRVCQILFEGNYSHILKPMVHYLPLKKDFSNFEEIMRYFKDSTVHRALTTAAYDDLITSGYYSYRQFIQDFDVDLLKSGFRLDPSMTNKEHVVALLRRGEVFRKTRVYLRTALHHNFPGKSWLKTIINPL